MQDTLSLLRRDERLTLALRALYEQYGYRKFHMNRFEPYDFYAVHRDFLANGQIITFTDLDGKLMALRPDVTLSIVKKAREGAPTDRLYYTESVFLPTRDAERFRESFQVGIESIGEVTPYTNVEVVSLAVRSLSLIADDYVLDVSHTGYITGMLNALPMDGAMRKALSRCIEEKNMPEIAAIAAGQLAQDEVDRLLAILRLSGTLEEALAQARTLAANDAMLSSLDELEALSAALRAIGLQDALRLDFSISSDAKYYNGLMMRGYISGVPTAVLGGGRYDPLLARMGKPALSAMGFAIYFDALARYLSEPEDAAVDTVILHAKGADPAEIARVAGRHIAQGERIWVGTRPPADLACERVVEVTADA